MFVENMANDGKQTVYIKDLRPGMKNLHMIFIVLEIGKNGSISGKLPPPGLFVATMNVSIRTCTLRRVRTYR